VKIHSAYWVEEVIHARQFLVKATYAVAAIAMVVANLVMTEYHPIEVVD
jgi:hypothetical protein